MELLGFIFQIGLFIAALLATVFIIKGRYDSIKRNILLGRAYEPTSSPEERRKNMILIAFGQKKMFERPFVGLMHFVVYAGFLIINMEVLEIVIDGISGQHRVFASILGSLYPIFIGLFEMVALMVVIACVVFLLRRNLMKLHRFHKNEMKGWPSSDANLILFIEITLMFLLFSMNATDSLLQLRAESHYIISESPMLFSVSRALMPLYSNFSTEVLITLERMFWWFHILGIFSFAVYVTYSKHLHIFLAFVNTYYADLGPRGAMENMDSVTKEVKIAMGLVTDSGSGTSMDEIPSFGAKDVTDLKWKNILDAYTCTECGRCTSECPANITGKALSPRKIMMDTRDRAEEVGAQLDLNLADMVADGKMLYKDYITKEEIMACTSCNACVEACPVNINPLDIILQLRRYVAMEEASVPDSWKAMLSNVQNNAAPWAFSSSDRFKWAEDMISEK